MTSTIWNPMPARVQRGPSCRSLVGFWGAWRAAMAAGLMVLAGCGGGGGGADPAPAPAPSNEAPLLITAPGTPVGDAVSVTVAPAGGAASAAGVNVVARDGSFVTDATLTLRPTTNPVQEGLAALEVSSSHAWSKPLTVIFPINADDESPQGLGVAVQLADGSWLDLPAKVDLAAGTVRAILPYDTEAAPAASTGSAHAAARERPQAAGDVIKRVVKYPVFYLRPKGATVKVGESRTFVAYARRKTSFECEPSDPDEWGLVPLCRLPLIHDDPFTHDKAGFDRYWSVDAIPWGSSEVGTIAKAGSSTVRYTAPQRKPSPDTVTVQFHSVNVKTGRSVRPMTAQVKIVDEAIRTYVGPVTVQGKAADVPFALSGDVTWTLVEHLPGDLSRYEATGTVEVTTIWRPDCDPASGQVPVSGSMIVYDPVREGPGDPYASKYWFNLQPAATVMASTLCGDDPRKPEVVPLAFMAVTVCPGDTNEATALRYDVNTQLKATGSWTCPAVQNNATYEFNAK